MGFVIDRLDRLWKDGVVPYRISTALNVFEQDEIEDAIDCWNETGLIHLRPKKRGDDNFIFFRRSNEGCRSGLGMQGGRQNISCQVGLFDGFNSWHLVHEIGHAIGLIHEHTRPDRDNHVIVHENNIRAESLDQYEIDPSGRTVGAYDYNSIMHYRGRSENFSINENRNTISRLRRGPKIGQRDHLSKRDLAAVKFLYGKESGTLRWYRHRDFKTGGNDWVFDHGKRVGNGWHRPGTLFGSLNHHSVVYAVNTKGSLTWRGFDGFDGVKARWRRGHGRRISGDFKNIRMITATSNGVIYTLGKDGKVRWHRHLGAADGSADWADGFGTVIAENWHDTKRIFASTQGVLYRVNKAGNLRWYRHMDYRDGGPRWHRNSTALMGTGWQKFSAIVSLGRQIYGIWPGGKLRWYDNRGFMAGVRDFTSDSGKVIGTGWQIYDQLITTGTGRFFGRIRRGPFGV